MSSKSAEVELQGRNAFHALAASGSVRQASKMLSTTPKKIVVTCLMEKDKTGRTPSHLAAYYGHIRVFKAFVDAYPEAQEVRDNEGNTARDALRRPHATVLGDPEFHRNFQRLVKLDKNGYEFVDFGNGQPMDVWDVAMSRKTSVVVVNPAWKSSSISKRRDQKSVYCIMNNTPQHLDLGSDHTPRFVATSNIHSLIITPERCFAWGKNKCGVLGLNTEEKVSEEPRMSDFYFGNGEADEDSRHFNIFSALNHGSSSSTIRNPSIGVACCDFYSCCYTTTRSWCWGTNRGQMVNKAAIGAVVSDPELIFETDNRIRSVSCCDSALLVSTTNGQVHVLSGSRVLKLPLGKSYQSTKAVEYLAAKGNYVVVQTLQRKLLRLKMPTSGGSIADYGDESITTIWTPRKPKDEVSSFDVGENGMVIVATKAGVYKVEDGRDIQESKNSKGMPITAIRTDASCKSSLAVCNIDASLTFSDDRSPIRPRYHVQSQYLHWAPTAGHRDLTLNVANNDDGTGGSAAIIMKSARVHKAVSYARCPTLRPLLDKSSKNIIAVPSGSASFLSSADEDAVLVKNAPIDAVKAFVRTLYCSTTSNTEVETELENLAPSSRHEYNALRRLATRELGLGLWEARNAAVGCDVTLESNVNVHSAVMRSASPVIAAQWSRWPEMQLDCPALSTDKELEEAIIKYAYTLHLDLDPKSEPLSLQERAGWLFASWQASDELLMANLSEECERSLFKMIDLEMVVPFLNLASTLPHIGFTKIYSTSLDIVTRHLAFFAPMLSESDSKSLENIENIFTAINGSEKVDVTLAESFELSKSRLASGSNNDSSSATKKKPRTVSSSLKFNPLSNPPTTPSAKGFSPRSKTPSNSNQTDVKASKSPWNNVDPIKPSPTNDDMSTGWIQMKKKSRVGSNNGADRTPVKVALSGGSIMPNTPMSTKSTGSIPSVTTPISSPWAAAVGGNNATPLNSRTSSSRATPTASSASPFSSSSPSYAASSSASSSSSVSASSSTSSLPSLPKLGGGLPKLGDNLPKLGANKSRTKSSAGKTSKPKFNSKDTIQFDSPFAMAQQMQKTAEPATPWKQVPKVVQTSPSVLQKLEREHQINSRRMAGQSVWGVKN